MKKIISVVIKMEDNLDATIWGPKFWFFLHTTAFAYPSHPDDVVKKKYYEMVQNMPIFIPVQKMGTEFGKILNQYPVSPYLDSKKSFIKWTHYIHNKVNEKLHKDTISLQEFYDMYADYYKPSSAKLVDTLKWRDRIIYTGVVIGLFSLIIILYRR